MLCVVPKAKQKYRQIYFNRAVSINRSAVPFHMSFHSFFKGVVERKLLTLYIYLYNLALLSIVAHEILYRMVCNS
jgi:hypothetical protein